MKKTMKALLTLLVATALTACGSTPAVPSDVTASDTSVAPKINVKTITNDFVNGKDLYVFHTSNNDGGKFHLIPKKAELDFETGFWNVEIKTGNILIPADRVFVAQILGGMTAEASTLLCPICDAKLGTVREYAKQ